MAGEVTQAPSPDYFLDSASGAFVPGKTKSSFADVARILDKAAKQNPENGLVIHFHGGLVSRDYALGNIVAPLTTKYLENANAYPIFFVWESGLKETLVNNKTELLKDPTFRELIKKVTEFTIKKTSFEKKLTFRGPDGTQIEDIRKFRQQYDDWFNGTVSQPPVPDAGMPSAVVAAPFVANRSAALPTEDALANEVLNSFAQDRPFKDAFGEAYNALLPPPQDTAEAATRAAATGTTKSAGKVLLSESAIRELFPLPANAATDTKARGPFVWFKVAKYVAKIILAVLKRFRDDRDHGVYCTVVEEVLRSGYIDLLGSNVWNQMKNDTQDSFNKDDSCGAAVINHLKALEGQGFKKITLVGHSTGAIYICNFLDAAKKAGLNFDTWQVAFLAPAVTCMRFAQAIKEHGDDRLRNFRMFAMTDELESDDKLVPVLYTRSLLYLVSGVLEGVPKDIGWEGVLDMPLVGMQRFVDGNKTFEVDKDVKIVFDFLHSPDHPHRIVWSPQKEAAEGLNSTSRKHGDFDNDVPTIASLSRFVRG